MTKKKAAAEFVDCSCGFADMDPATHDALVAVEKASVYEALELFGTLALGDVHPGFEAGQFSLFVGEHFSRWRDPDAMERLASLFDCVALDPASR